MTGWKHLAIMVVAAVLARPAHAQDVIRLGDLSSYGRYPAFTEPYRNGWRLAFEEINAGGGILGKGVEVVSRDDGGNVAEAVQAADELVNKDKVSLLFGTFLSAVALAVADHAGQNRLPFIATLPLSDALTLARGNRYTFRPLRASISMQTAMLADAARGLTAKRWAIIAPDYEYGFAAANAFRSLMAELDSGAQVVVEQYTPLGRIDAAASAASIAAAKPDAIFSALFGADLAAFAREAKRQGLLEPNKVMLNLLAGEPEWVDILGSDAPEGAIVTGLQGDDDRNAKLKAFSQTYRSKFGSPPAMASLIGYMTGYLIKDAIEKAGSLEAEKLVDTLESLSSETIVGPVSMRTSDHQGTFGTSVGKLAVQDGRAVMVDATYVDGAEFLPPEDEVDRLRPK